MWPHLLVVWQRNAVAAGRWGQVQVHGRAGEGGDGPKLPLLALSGPCIPGLGRGHGGQDLPPREQLWDHWVLCAQQFHTFRIRSISSTSSGCVQLIGLPSQQITNTQQREFQDIRKIMNSEWKRVVGWSEWSKPNEWRSKMLDAATIFHWNSLLIGELLEKKSENSAVVDLVDLEEGKNKNLELVRRGSRLELHPTFFEFIFYCCYDLTI